MTIVKLPQKHLLWLTDFFSSLNSSVESRNYPFGIKMVDADRAWFITQCIDLGKTDVAILNGELNFISLRNTKNGVSHEIFLFVNQLNMRDKNGAEHYLEQL
ncbi:hypothetical protein AAE045_09455 [Dryocola clanedunensis]